MKYHLLLQEEKSHYLLIYFEEHPLIGNFHLNLLLNRLGAHQIACIMLTEIENFLKPLAQSC